MKASRASKGGKASVSTKATQSLRRSSQTLANPSLRRQSQLLASRSVMESKSRLHALSRGPRRKDEDGFRDVEDGELDSEWTGPKELVPPPDQLQLTEQELKEEFTRVLTADNPHAPPNIIRFSFKEKTFKQASTIEQTAFHFAMDSNFLHKESDEAQRQLDRQEGGVASSGDESGEEGSDKDEDRQDDAEQQIKKKKMTGGEKQLRNQFNFSERASQTLNNPYRDRGTATEPPPRANFAATANQMEIFDAYVEDLIRQDKAKDKKGAKSSSTHEEEKKRPLQSDFQNDDVTRVSSAAKVMERMVNQNSFDDIAQDFKYYEDPGDDFREGKGNLLPLWRFKYDKGKKTGITALCWSPLYNDLFAVGHGSYDFSGQGSGLICFYSLKNPSYPEYVFPVSSGVMCLDIHPDHPFLLAAGMYDGSVALYNLKDGERNPLYRATAKSGKHTDPVWQVCWQKNDMDGNINFSSVSSDGRVVTWQLVKNELQHQDTVQLTIPGTKVQGPEGTQNMAISSGTAIGFNKMADHLFLVGSEEGTIYKCSKAYTSHFLDIYEAHHMAVHDIRWNPFHSDVFASCGADWTVKIWDHNRKEPMFTFDLNSVVGGVAWAPYCSTVFAAVTADGKVCVFDLSINKYEALCVQSVIQKKRTKLTHIEFNPSHPVLIVGDDKGSILCLKLSPNLRRALKEKTYSRESEIAKMDKLISFVREPLLEERRLEIEKKIASA